MYDDISTVCVCIYIYTYVYVYNHKCAHPNQEEQRVNQCLHIHRLQPQGFGEAADGCLASQTWSQDAQPPLPEAKAARRPVDGQRDVLARCFAPRTSTLGTSRFQQRPQKKLAKQIDSKRQKDVKACWMALYLSSAF